MRLEPEGDVVHAPLLSYIDVPANFLDELSGLGSLSLALGFLRDGRACRSMAELVLHNSSSRADEIVFEDQEYRLRIQVNPAKSWMAERIEFDRKGLTDDPDRPLKERYQVEESAMVDGVWFPMSYSHERVLPAGKRRLPEGIRIIDGNIIVVPADAPSTPAGSDVMDVKARTFRSQVRFDGVRIRPIDKSEFHIQSAIPNGTPVSMVDARHLDYIWKDGKIIPKVNEVDRWGFMAGDKPRRALIVTAIGTLFAIIILIRVRARRSR